nr:MAG TPA: hypothetical protein [Caudoviricetes sp.]
MNDIILLTTSNKAPIVILNKGATRNPDTLKGAKK